MWKMRNNLKRVMQALSKEKIEALEKEIEHLKRKNEQLKKELAEVNRLVTWALKKVYSMEYEV